MHQIFVDHINGGVFIYLDDIVVYGKTKEEFLAKIRSVFELVRKHNLRLKADKSIAGKSELPLLGYVVSGEGVRMGQRVPPTKMRPSEHPAVPDQRGEGPPNGVASCKLIWSEAPARNFVGDGVSTIAGLPFAN